MFYGSPLFFRRRGPSSPRLNSILLACAIILLNLVLTIHLLGITYVPFDWQSLASAYGIPIEDVGSVSGTTTYSGGATGQVIVSDEFDADHIWWTPEASPGSYSLTNVLYELGYYLSAYIDSNGNTNQEPWEVSGVYTGNLLSITGDISGVDIELDDVDDDIDGLPDWWEVDNFGDITTSDGTGDADGDGFTDLQEYTDGTDPNVVNPWALVVSGSPEAHSSSSPYNYGTNSVSNGLMITNTAVSPANVTNGIRYVCTGWIGTGSIPAVGYTASCVATITNDSSITWQWTQQYSLNVSNTAYGSVDLPTPWVKSPVNEHWYGFTSTTGTWHWAHAAAQSVGGYLVSISNSTENAWVMNTMTTNVPGVNVWMGLCQSPGSTEPSGGWYWTSGEPLVYSNWASSEPNDDRGEDITEFKGLYSSFPGKWNDQNGTNQMFLGVVEYDSISGWYPAGHTNVIVATPASNGVFTAWSGDISATNNSIALIMTQAWSVAASFATSDADADGLPDAWEMNNFGDITTSDGTGDADGDGFTDLQEYTDGTDPNDFNSQPGLIAFYPFSGNANDASGNNHTGIVNGATLTADMFGVTNSAYSFDGSNYINLNVSPPLTGIVNTFTISTWIKPDNQVQSRTYIHRADMRDVQMIWNGGIITWSVDEDTGVDEDHSVASAVLPTNEWTHVLGTYDGSVQSLYVNGQLVGVSNWTGTVNWDTSFMAEGIGGHSATGTDRFEGDIDEVRIYNRALSSNEVQNLFNKDVVDSELQWLVVGDSLGNIVVRNVKTAGIYAQTNINGVAIGNLGAVDVDEDGATDLIASMYNTVDYPSSCLSVPSLMPKWQSSANTGFDTYDHAIFGVRFWSGDFDGDSNLDIMIPAYAAGTKSFRIFDAATGQFEQEAASGFDWYGWAMKDEQAGSWRLFTKRAPDGFTHYGRCYDMSNTNALLWENTGVNWWKMGGVASNMVDGTARVWGGWYSRTLYVVDGGGTSKWQKSFGGSYEADAIYAGDLKGDGVETILVGGTYGNGMTRLDAARLSDGATIWTHDDTNAYWAIEALDVVDVDGDGVKEVFAVNSHSDEASGRHPKYEALNGLNGSVLWEQNYAYTDKMYVGSAWADVEGDGTNEILLAVNNFVEARNPLTGSLVTNFEFSSEIRSFVVINGLEQASPVEAPAWLVASFGEYSDRIELSWGMVSNSTGYTVWRAVTNDSAQASQIASSIATNWTDTTVTPDTHYWYWVKATNAVGSSGFSTIDEGWAQTPGGNIQILSGSISGQAFTNSMAQITIEQGGSITGSVNVRVYNAMPGSAIAPLCATPTWGTPQTSFWGIDSWVPTGNSDHNTGINLTAPTNAGIYYIVFAMAGTYNYEQIMSGTHPGWSADWVNGDKVALLPDTDFEIARDRGWIRKLWYMPGSGWATGHLACAAIKVEVTDSNAWMTNGLVAYYPFNGNANDESGNGHGGTVTGCVLTADMLGAADGAYAFDGTNDYIEVVDSEDLNLTQGSFSLSVLAKRDTATRLDMLVTKRGTVSPLGWMWGINDDHSTNAPFCRQRLSMSSPSAGHPTVDSDSFITTSMWHHLVVVYDAPSTTATFFVDGLFDGASVIEPSSNVATNLRIGGDTVSSSYDFNGTLDDLRIYDRAISSNEVWQLADTDVDGLPDVWEANNFGDITTTDGTTDTDGDGFTDLQEYQNGTDPNVFDPTITATASANGSVTPSGAIQLIGGQSTNILVQANTNWHIAEVFIDAEPLGIFGPGSNTYTHTFTTPTNHHTLYATFNTGPTMACSVSPTSGPSPLRVEFDFTQSTDPESNIVYSAVDPYGTGEWATRADGAGICIVEYPVSGVHTASVKVVDAYGIEDTSTVVITVWGVPPAANLSATPTSGDAPLWVSFDATNSTAAAGRSIVVYEWDFEGDGIIDLINKSGLTSNLYSAAGSYTPLVRVTDDAGLQSEDSVPITVAAPPVLIPPTVTLSAAPASGKIPLDVTLMAAASDSDGTISEYRWDLYGDGTIDMVTAGSNTTVTYTLPGSYSPSVTVVDNDGLTASDSASVSVSEAARLKVWISTPKDGRKLEGDAVTVHAQTAPGSLTASLLLQYSASGSNNWIDMGPIMYPPANSYKQTWDVSGLTDLANYDLRAIGGSTQGGSVTSLIVTVQVDVNGDSAVGHINEDDSTGKHVKKQKLGKDQTTTADIYDGTEVTVPAETTTSNLTLEIEVTGANTNTVDGSAAHKACLNKNRKVSLEGNPELKKPLEIVIPYDDADDDGVVDGTGIPETTISAHWYDTSAGKWKKALETQVLPKENKVKIKTYHLTEFGLFGSQNLLHPASGGRMDSYTSQRTNTVAAAFISDGNTASYWESAQNPGVQQFVFSFTNYQGAICNEAVLYNYGQAGQGLTNYSSDAAIYTSMDGSNWTSVASTNLPASEDAQTLGMNNATGRYVKLVISNGVKTAYWDLAEFEVHGTLTKDPDADGMDDDWEMFYFGNFDRGGSGDLESDGLTDVNEFMNGANPTTNDTDGDIMADAWEVQYGLQVATNDASGDDDGDGLSNLGEYISGYIPNNNNSVFETPGPAMTNSQQMVFEWTTMPGRVYYMLSNSNLMSGWSTSSPPIVGGGMVSFTNSTTNATRKFYRLKVDLQ